MTGTAYVPSWQAYIEAGEHRTGLVLRNTIGRCAWIAQPGRRICEVDHLNSLANGALEELHHPLGRFSLEEGSAHVPHAMHHHEIHIQSQLAVGPVELV